MSEVASFVLNVSQFEPGESSGECVAFCAAQIIRMAPPDTTNTHTPEDIDTLADTIYKAVTGQTTEAIGINTDQLKAVLTNSSIRFAEIGKNIASPDIESIDAALSSGCPVIVQGHQSGFQTTDGKSPYSWNTDGIDHCIIIVGIFNQDAYWCLDSANAQNGYVVYLKGQMQLFSAIKVVPTWIGGNMIPNGWTDDGSTLTAPNGHKVVLGFRSYILNNTWDSGNYPLEEEHGQSPLEVSNPSLGDGTQQIFRYTALEYTAEQGVFVGWIGQELLAVRNAATATGSSPNLTTKLRQMVGLMKR